MYQQPGMEQPVSAGVENQSEYAESPDLVPPGFENPNQDLVQPNAENQYAQSNGLGEAAGLGEASGVGEAYQQPGMQQPVQPGISSPEQMAPVEPQIDNNPLAPAPLAPAFTTKPFAPVVAQPINDSIPNQFAREVTPPINAPTYNPFAPAQTVPINASPLAPPPNQFAPNPNPALQIPPTQRY